MKPILYLDVDGTLFATYDGSVQLRPYVSSFLRWCVERFEVRWLTCWPKHRLDGLFRHLMAGELFKQTHYQQWGHFSDHHLPNPGKTDGIATQDLARPFFWVEDRISPEEFKWLLDRGWGDRYYDISAEGASALVDARMWLERQYGLLTDREESSGAVDAVRNDSSASASIHFNDGEHRDEPVASMHFNDGKHRDVPMHCHCHVYDDDTKFAIDPCDGTFLSK